VDRLAGSAEHAVEGADLVILATPVRTVTPLLAAIAPHLAPGAVVTDTASSKALVLEWAARWLPATAEFVGGHPMAGREMQGIEGAQADLFEGCTYCLVTSASASPRAIERVAWLADAVGGHPLNVSAVEHDRAVAGISHLPLLLSAALVGCTATHPEWALMSRLAASGYRDVSRLASGDPRMGRDICLSNAAALVAWIDRFYDELAHLRGLVAQRDPAIEARLSERQALRDAWVEHAKRV
jgi:prephenate dehydrogenase